MRLPLAFTAVLVFGPSSALTSSIHEKLFSPWSVEGIRVLSSGVKDKILGTENHLDEQQSSSSSGHKDVNDRPPIFLPPTRTLGTVPRALETRATLPMPQSPPRDSYSDGYYQPIICSSRFGAHITVPGCLHVIYGQVLDEMDQMFFRRELRL